MERLSVVVPYRDRQEHLNQFIPHMEKLLKEDEIDFKIFIIEQADDKLFNRAKLLNVGFNESKDFDYFAFHDVDMLPLDSDYSYPEGPTHIATQVEQFNWGLPYDGYFGGVTLFDKQSFIDINGYSNEYWGWGAEDDDVLHRCMVKEIETFRKDECKYRSLQHDRSIVRPAYLQNLSKLEDFQRKVTPLDIIDSDGLSTLNYTKIEEIDLTPNSKLIRVTL